MLGDALAVERGGVEMGDAGVRGSFHRGERSGVVEPGENRSPSGAPPKPITVTSRPVRPSLRFASVIRVSSQAIVQVSHDRLTC